MKLKITTSILSLLTLLAVPSAPAADVVLRTCTLPSGVTVLHNGRCEDLARERQMIVRAPDTTAPAAESFARAGAISSRWPDGLTLKRDAFLAFAKTTMKDVCEKPQSPFARMSTSMVACRRTLTPAIAQCEKTMRTKLPAEIGKHDGEHWSVQVAQCVVGNFILLAAPGDLNPNG